jgi:hypothetical protein
VALTRAAKLLAFAGNVVAVVVLLDTLARLGRDDRTPARSADVAAERLRADPALSRHPAGGSPARMAASGSPGREPDGRIGPPGGAGRFDSRPVAARGPVPPGLGSPRLRRG